MRLRTDHWGCRLAKSSERSGADKSTLLHTVDLLERPTSGRILLDGEYITQVQGSERRDARCRIGMVFQHFSLMSSKTVWENVLLSWRLAVVDDAITDQRLRNCWNS
ncbi:ATP-binding cassette domain-containing protein [Paeniglutamicibacter terrestris]|uniref:ATP-binding cassette domain-containing protein n=1 Tax=Paeniglutamicibacter terrestris TaxID=2723403 RepID=A0ABX1G284_9MICC|nr:ATP-binding cassette domain-containing protein [Paeniglutamicibacter terrestris]